MKEDTYNVYETIEECFEQHKDSTEQCPLECGPQVHHTECTENTVYENIRKYKLSGK